MKYLPQTSLRDWLFSYHLQVRRPRNFPTADPVRQALLDLWLNTKFGVRLSADALSFQQYHHGEVPVCLHFFNLPPWANRKNGLYLTGLWDSSKTRCT